MRGVTLIFVLFGVAACDRSLILEPPLAGTYVVVPRELPRTTVQHNCAIIGESGELFISGARYVISYDQENRCPGNQAPLMFRIEDRGTVVRGDFSGLSFKSDASALGTYEGEVRGGQIIVQFNPFERVIYQRR